MLQADFLRPDAMPIHLEQTLFLLMPVRPKPSPVNHTTTRRSKYARRWFPGVIQVAPQEAVTLFFFLFFFFFISYIRC